MTLNNNILNIIALVFSPIAIYLAYRFGSSIGEDVKKYLR